MNPVEVNIAEEPAAICDANGWPLLDRDGMSLFTEPGWHAVRDQFGEVCWGEDGNPLFEEFDEDQLVLVTREAPGQTPQELSEWVFHLETALGHSGQTSN